MIALSPAASTRLTLMPFIGFVADPVLAAALAGLLRRHQGVFARLDGLRGKRLRIEPQGLPFAFELELCPPPARARLRMTSPGTGVADAVVRGPIAALVDLMEGRLDGDALFFSRILTFEGETELIVALRNALDGEDIDLARDLAASLGPFAGPAEQGLKMVRALVLGGRR